jgi:hypothetical protein
MAAAVALAVILAALVSIGDGDLPPSHWAYREPPAASANDVMVIRVDGRSMTVAP